MSNHIEQTLYQQFKALPRAEALLELQQVLGEEHQLYLVGGAVRDLATGKEPRDFDLAIGLSPEILATLLHSKGLRVISTGARHQTVTTLLSPDAFPVEITSFHGAGMRPDLPPRIGRTIEEDLAHRDFTINALALSLTNGALVDPHGGLTALQNRELSAVGDACERFAEDPLRILRMVRIAAELEFSINNSTFAAAENFVQHLAAVAPERIRDEFSKLLLSAGAVSGFHQLAELGVLKLLFPELAACVGFEQNRFHDHDVFEHTLLVISLCPTELTLRLAALLHDIGKPPTLTVDERRERHFYRHEVVGAELAEQLLSRLCYPKQTVQAVTELVRLHMRTHLAGASGIRRIIRDVGELYPVWRELKQADAKGCRADVSVVLAELAEFDASVAALREKEHDSFLKLAIGGNDILDLGVLPGPRIGEILRALHELVLDNPECNSRERLLETVLSKGYPFLGEERTISS